MVGFGLYLGSLSAASAGSQDGFTSWKPILEESEMIITKGRTALTVAAASLGLAALVGPAMAAGNDKHGTPGAVKAYNWDIPAGTASPSA